MVHTYKIPLRDRLIILTNLMLMMIGNVVMWQISNVLLVPLLIFMVFEMMITGILLKWGLAVDTLKSAVVVTTGMFVLLVIAPCAITLTSLCCRVSPGLWITILVFYIILRIIYALRLHFIAKLCRNDYPGKCMMNVNSQQVDAKTSTPMAPTTQSSEASQFVAKLCRNDYPGKCMMSVNSQQVDSKTSTPMAPTTQSSETSQFVAKLCPNDYPGKCMMNINSQQVDAKTSTPMKPTTQPSGISERQSEFINVEAIGFAKYVTGKDPNALRNYGWAV